MRVLVTGGTGVVGQAAVSALTARGHEVRLLSRHAEQDAAQWPRGVTPVEGNVADAASIAGSAEGCDAVLHVAGIVAESPPEVTFERVNVGGTRNVVREAERAGVRRLVYVSSLGADRGQSPYHQSKRAGEEVVRGFRNAWVIVRPGNVYGPGDEVVSLLLKMVRTLPVIPVLDRGDQRFQPVWADDVGEALVAALEREDVAGRALELAGHETTTMHDILDRLERVTDRHPARIPVPGFLASIATRVAEGLGAPMPINSNQLTMLDEENVVRDPAGNALTTVLGVRATPLDEGLRKLADALPEVLPEEGVGALTRKRFWADIVGSPLTAEQLFEHFRTGFSEITPGSVEVGVEPATPTVPREGETLTMKLPVRGNIQVRVEELSPRRMTLMTLEGHPLAGAVRFLAEERGDCVRFEAQVYDRAASIADWVMMNPVGAAIQNRTWKETVEHVVEQSGGTAPRGVEEEIEKLDTEQAERINEWLRELVMERRREDREGQGGERSKEGGVRSKEGGVRREE